MTHTHTILPLIVQEIQRKELAAQEKEISMMENNLEKITNPLRKVFFYALIKVLK